jgi:8-oxo-dGTP pyrophosphatase MutT (NUDIX family)
MANPIPSAPGRRTNAPLPSAIGAHVAPAPHPAQASLPTVEEVSAGGVVVDTSDGELRVAIIARLNRGGRLEWCLPKGHPEGKENNEQAAVREIAEETGIEGDVLAPLGSIDYWFTVSGHRVHKTVHHFLLRATGGELTIENDPDQEAIDAAWVPLHELARKLSFPNERRIADLAKEVLPEHL